jgi:hypothetical protein
MRIAGIGFGIVVLLAAAPAFAGTSLPENPVTTGSGNDTVPTISRGHEFAITCADIATANSDVRVLMSVADAGNQPTDHSSIMATTQHVSRHAVSVTVPDMPEFANHTVNVRVFVTSGKGTKQCDVGRVRIG